MPSWNVFWRSSHFRMNPESFKISSRTLGHGFANQHLAAPGLIILSVQRRLESLTCLTRSRTQSRGCVLESERSCRQVLLDRK
ncbi:uncharacterized protein LACBIDRAFT_304529 [Laccaria bicolor S238N-H82]|uniref:Predicted protein n=1 Tax=Laccaria bicolor (strain S238N-H82 / ATCC MYA-4686) TaxID=486041 RepID=B0DLU5_LACBS|nr:uncharacterized protein LACBIDRAFT_304529 [Laccaria bicolor S238N-H82]EDR04352.1 predicted protein [Laccaria bicolor S238N-H82]|eukprot:XP_001884871.1 predicted protein [Laccaria bicolor S238N-H82]